MRIEAGNAKSAKTARSARSTPVMRVLESATHPHRVGRSGVRERADPGGVRLRRRCGVTRPGLHTRAETIFALIKMKQLDLEFATWGGRRDGAGRRRAPGRGAVPHHRRERHAGAHPVHVTMRARRGLPPFRERVLFAAMRERIRAANASPAVGGAFRVVHFSVQNDHVHLIVEAAAARDLARGVQGLAIRLAKGINVTLGARGRVWADRFHSRELTTPRSVRNAIVYVLMNAKKHGALRRGGVDAMSSAPWFDGFVRAVDPPRGPSPVRPPETWLARVGWRRRALVAFDEAPRTPA